MPQIKLERDVLIAMLQQARSKVDLSILENRDVIDAIEKIVSWVATAPLAEIKSQFPRTFVGR